MLVTIIKSIMRFIFYAEHIFELCIVVGIQRHKKTGVFIYTLVSQLINLTKHFDDFAELNNEFFTLPIRKFKN